MPQKVDRRSDLCPPTGGSSTFRGAGEIEVLFQKCVNVPNNSNFQVLFERSRPLLAATLISSFPSDISIVEDALQDAYLKIFVMLKKRQLEIRSVNYLVVIAKNCLVDELRKRKGKVTLDELTQDEHPRYCDEDGSRAENLGIIIAAMTKLDQRTKFVLESYYLQERHSREIAKDIGVQHESIYMILKRSREYFRAVIETSRSNQPSLPQFSGAEPARHLAAKAR